MNHFSVCRSLRSFFLVPALAILAACGGGHDSAPPQAATKLHYVNPPASGFRLEAEPSTNDSAHLVLNLMGPSGTSASGVAFFLTCDTTKAAWSNPGGSSDPLAKAGAAFTLGPVPLFKSKQLQSTGDLQVGLFQTGATAIVLRNVPIVSVALDLKPNSGMPAGTRVGLTPTDGKTSKYLDGLGADQAMTIGVGVLTAQ